ncbi:hypothetical protein NHG76_17160 [Vibrio cholerae]|uniref:Uncharacterized protein n=1 Tax=Vibrio cholerae TaxID=666 RepID=A0ABD7SJE9_VIBCL|nr:hypothetical protein [Vibrio cholerae]TXX64742.1 hypothetical protein FXF03_14755 [Vibrio cholerae]GIB05496.1 hypothetical protein VCSRO136_3871 [Vibrio cholerae]HBC3563737.1 hypothetical protein [Vibrio cholerae]
MEFVDKLLDIIEKTEDYDFARGLLVQDLLNFPSNTINNEVRNALNEMLKPNNKSLYVCGHQGCVNKSIFSHEMSENVFLKQLADSNGMVCELTTDFRNNALKSWFKPVHKGNATNFPGYCRDHDRSIFEDIEEPFPGFTDKFYHKYCLRLLRRDLFEIDKKLKLFDVFINKLADVCNDEVKAFKIHMEKKKSINLERKERSLLLYNELFDSIEKGQSYLNVYEFDVRECGYCFSKVFDFTSEDDCENAIIFIVKLEHNKKSKFVIVSIKNETSDKLAIGLHPKENHTLWHLSQIMIENKGHLVFSHDFSSSLDEHTKDIMTREHSMLPLSKIDNLLLSQVFF